MNILERITESQRARVARRRRQRSLRELRASIDPELAPRGTFARSLRRVSDVGVRFICEIKHPTPPATLREPYPPEALAYACSEGGAAAIAVVTEERYFLGDRGTVGRVRRAVDRPVLMKDFVVDPYQLVEARVLGADAVLLIAALLGADGLRRFIGLARKLGLECLVEIHDEAELERAIDSGAWVLVVNNRDLATFQVDLATTERLCRLLPADCVLVSEGGIRTRDDILRLEQTPVDAVLLDETLVRADNPAQVLGRLMGS